MRPPFLVLMCLVLGASTALASGFDDDSPRGSDDRQRRRGVEDGGTGRNGDDGRGGDDDFNCADTFDDSGHHGGRGESGRHSGEDGSGHHSGRDDSGRRDRSRSCDDLAMMVGCSAGGGELVAAPLLAVLALIGISLRHSCRGQ